MRPGAVRRCIAPVMMLAIGVMTGCASRPLTEAERSFTATLQGDEIDVTQVRIVNGAASALLEVEIPPRPRTTCREKLFPPRDTPAQGSFPAFVTGQTMYFARDIFAEDFFPDYPDAMDLPTAMRLAHEMTHVWQWQNRRITGYSPFAAAAEHVELDDPYLTEIDPDLEFLDYGWEQQGILAEEFVCCRALDPEGARTDDLFAVLSEVFPTLNRREAVPTAAITLPWAGAEPRGICS